MIDGIDLATINLQSYRTQVGYVGQQPALFNQSVRDNIKYGKPDATDDQICAALDMANAKQLVEQLPDKLSTRVGSGGLSGGQKQRIALA